MVVRQSGVQIIDMCVNIPTGRITDQSNRSGPFSLVVMTFDYRSRGTWFDPRSGHPTGVFSLQVYFSSYYNWYRDQDDYHRSPRKLSERASEYIIAFIMDVTKLFVSDYFSEYIIFPIKDLI